MRQNQRWRGGLSRLAHKDLHPVKVDETVPDGVEVTVFVIRLCCYCRPRYI